MRFVCWLILAGCGWCWTSAGAQPYPAKPVNLVVPFAAGGPADVLGRLLAERMGAFFGQAFVVNNQPGAGSGLGTRAVAAAPADGYQLLLTSPHALNLSQLVPGSKGEDLSRDLRAVALVAENPTYACVGASSGIKSLTDMKGGSQQRSIGYVQAGAPWSGANELRRQLNPRALLIPYKGYEALLAAAANKEIEMITVPRSLALREAARITCIASLSSIGPAVGLPEARSQGVPIDASERYFVLAPRATPDAVVLRLREAVGKAVADNGFREGLAKAGLLPAAASDLDAETFLRRELSTIQAVIGKTDGPGGGENTPSCPGGEKWCAPANKCIKSSDTCK